jgi:photosystem II stability/assembly factor-like uncharacterized protein
MEALPKTWNGFGLVAPVPDPHTVRNSLDSPLVWGSTVFIFAVILLCGSIPASGQNPEVIGPPGGRVMDIAVSPSAPSTVYAATDNGLVYRSTDSGESSVFLNPAGQEGRLYFGQVNVHPSDADAVYASGKRSTDGGQTWTASAPPVHDVTFNPLDDDVMYARRKTDELWISRDGGTSWDTLAILENVGPLAISAADTSVLYMPSNGGVRKSEDSGQTWEYTTLPDDEAQVSPQDIAVHPQDENTAYLSLGNRKITNGIYKTTDGGASWKLVFSGSFIHELAINPDSPDTVYAASGDYLSSYPGSVVKTTDGGETWKARNEGLPAAKGIPMFLYDIEISPANPEELYVGLYGWGVYHSENGGATWQRTRLTAAGTLTNMDIYVDPKQPGHLYVGTYDQGIFKTADAGTTWTRLDLGVSNTVQTPMRQITFDPNNHSYAYVAGGQYGVFKSSNGGQSWTLTSLRGSFDTYLTSVAVHPEHSDTVFAGQRGWLSRDLYRSTNRGKTWTDLNVTGGSSSIQDILFAPGNPRVLYVATSGRGVVKSTDGGATWTEKNDGFRAAEGEFYPVNALDAAKMESGFMLYALQPEEKGRGGVFHSQDGGEEWIAMDSSLKTLDENVEPQDVLVDPSDPDRIYVAAGQRGQKTMGNFSSGGLFLSEDRGNTWQRITSYPTSNIAHDPHHPGRIYYTVPYGIEKYDPTASSGGTKPAAGPHAEFELQPNYPNPFSERTTLTFNLPERETISLRVYDVLGRRVRTLASGEFAAGEHRFALEAGDLPSGVYVVRARVQSPSAGTRVLTRKVTLAR